MGYLLSRNYQESGPYEINALQDMIKTGAIEAGFWACKEGSKKWIEITKMPELKNAFAAQSQPENTPPAGKKPPAKKK